LKTLVGYTFGPQKRAHEFCGICGVALFGRAEGPTRAINVRGINNIALAELQLTKYDGKADLPLYEVQ
jgi:hypothetical protein